LSNAQSGLTIMRRDLDSIMRQGKAELPSECCGLMIGRREGERCVCHHIRPTGNADKSPYSFTIAPEELLKGYRHADDVSMELVGIYHTHPARPFPSSVDLGFMKWSAPVWLIVSSLNWAYAAYVLEGGRPVKVNVTLVQPSFYRQ